MTVERKRSEYRLPLGPGQFSTVVPGTERLVDDHRLGLAQLMLDAYRGSVDDDDETFAEACEAVDQSLDRCERHHSFVLIEGGSPIAMSLVLIFRDVYYIDPIAVTATHKRAGLGRRMVEASLTSLAAAGVTEVGATITDGNEPSERLFLSLGARRVGPWPSAED